MAGSRNKPFTDPISAAVDACLSRHCRAGQTVVVGYSGGIDSMVLLHAVKRVAGNSGLGISALHIHHGLSPNADAWAVCCGEVCSAIDVRLSVTEVMVPERSGEGIEAAARRVRHKALAEHPADWILLAHHADDQAETILHNLLRGAGVRGAAAMPELRGRVLRPLLAVGRETIEEYGQVHQLRWIEDESNSDTRYTRNFLRREILPAIAKRFPGAVEQLAAAASRFSEASELLDDLACIDLKGNPSGFPQRLGLLRELSAARARNLLRVMLTWQHVQPPDERRLNEFVRQLQSAGHDRHPRIDLVTYSLWCEGGRLHFRKNV
jgi:tRNA(Ile)-lysidine synthase